MAKKIYVKGGIVITTPYFKCPDTGCCFETPPEDSIIVEPNKIDHNGNPYLEISEENPQSIFNEYYAKDGLSAFYLGAKFLYINFNQAYDQYLHRNREIRELAQESNLTDQHRNILYRLCFVSVVASLETFVCDIILTRITENETEFKTYFNKICNGYEKEKLQWLLDNDEVGHWEQKVMDYIIKSSYSDITRIKRIFKSIFRISLTDNDGKINKHFLRRHIIAHRNGRPKDGDYIMLSLCEIEKLIDDTQNFAKQIMDKIHKVS